MTPPPARRLVPATLVAMAFAAPAQAAPGWLQSAPPSVGGELRGVGFWPGGGPVVLYGDTPGLGEDEAPTFERMVRRVPGGGPWLPPEASGLPPQLREVSVNTGGRMVAWRRGFDPASSLVVSSRFTSSRMDSGDWSPPLTLATGVRAAEVVSIDDGEALAAWVSLDGAVFAALRGRFGGWRPARRLEAPGSTPAGPVVGVNEAGDAVVVWSRGPAGRTRLRAAARQASLVRAPLEFAAARTLPGPVGLASPTSAAIDREGDAVVAWSLKRGSFVSDHRSGAAAWGPARPLPVPGGAVAVAAAGGAVALGSAGVGGRIVVATRGARASAWRRVPGPPASACCLVASAVTRMGDVVVAGTTRDFDDLQVFRRAVVGTGGWVRAPLRISPRYRQQLTRLRAKPEGDVVAAWSWTEGNTSRPLEAASFEAPALPRIVGRLRPSPTGFRRGATVRLRFPMNAPGRVLVSILRPFGGRALAAFGVAGRRGPNTVAIPRAAMARLLGPGRYVVVAETSNPRAGGSRPAVVRLLG